MFLGQAKLCFSNLIGQNINAPFRATQLRRVHVTGILQGKQKKSKGWFWQNQKEPDTFKIIPPRSCVESDKPIFDAMCKTAVIIGGSDGLGFAAADHLLCKGARNVVITDSDQARGKVACQKLCDFHGNKRAEFLHSDIKNFHQFEVTLKQIVFKYKQVHVLLNDLDKQRRPSESKFADDIKWSNTRRTIEVGLKLMSKQTGGGIIVNSASILGFMGWPEDPSPVYCMREPIIETTMAFAQTNKTEETGVRLVALCPVNKPFAEIGLPDFPDPLPGNHDQTCIPSSTWRVGAALDHVLSWAQNGSTWVIEPSICPYGTPRPIYFPKQGEKIDPKVYDAHACPIEVRTDCTTVQQREVTKKSGS